MSASFVSQSGLKSQSSEKQMHQLPVTVQSSGGIMGKHRVVSEALLHLGPLSFVVSNQGPPAPRVVSTLEEQSGV